MLSQMKKTSNSYGIFGDYMNILQPFKTVFTKAKRETNSFAARFLPNTAPQSRGARETIQSYCDTPWFRAANGRVSKSIASVTWELYAIKQGNKAVKIDKMLYASHNEKRRIFNTMKKEMELVEIEEHPLLTLINDCNRAMPGKTTRQLTQIYLDSVGEAFWLKERNSLGVPVEVWAIPPTWVTSVPLPGKPFFTVTVNSQQFNIPETEFIWFKEPNPVNPYGRGVGLGQSLRDEIDTDEFAAQHTKAWFYNKAKPELLITAEGLNREDAERLEQKWLEKSQGFWKAFKPMFLPAPSGKKVEIHELSQSFQDMQLIDLRKYERDTIIQVFGVPPEILGIIENSNRATIEAADLIFAKYCLVPRLETLREYFQIFLVPDFDERIIVDYVSPVAEDKEYQLRTAQAAPWALTKDEWRELMELRPLPDNLGQVFMVPAMLMEVPIGERKPQSEQGLFENFNNSQNEDNEENISENPDSEEEKNNKQKAQKKIQRKESIPILTQEQEQKRWEAKVNAWDSFEGKWKRELKKFFQKQQNEVLEKLRNSKAIEKISIEEILFNRALYNQLLTELARPLIIATMEAGFDEASELIGFEYGFDVTNPKIQRWIGNRLVLIKDINKTTEDLLREALRTGINEGEGISQLAERVTEVFNAAKGWRAENIARTETISAYVEGNIELYQEANITELEFYTATDERVCEDCTANHGVRYAINESTGVIPVHPSCRCDFIPIVER